MQIKTKTILIEAIICSAALILFSFFVSFGFPIRLIAFASLIAPAWIIGKNLKTFSDLKRVTGEISDYRSLFFYIAGGIAFGIGLAAFYRWHLDKTYLPSYLRSFALIAAMIGSVEELVFRGYIQGSLKNINPLFSIIFSTLAHTAYKCLLFLHPLNRGGMDIGFLFLWTFIMGLVLGMARHLSGSIIPSLTAHSMFDVLVYGELAAAPWWVW
jgi:membrane protease YdiL (CAAX protease family)